MSPLLTRLIAWTVRKIGMRRLFALSLMIVLQVSVAYGIETAVRRLPNSFLITAALLGLFTGWLLGASRWKGIWAALLVIFSAAIWNLIAAGKMGFLLLQAAAAAFELLFKGLPWKVDWTPLTDLLLLLASSIQAVLVDLNNWAYQVLHGNLSFSLAAAAFFWGLCCWLSAGWAGWWLRRRHEPLAAVLPGALLLAAVLNYTRTSSFSLALVLGSLLMLLALENYAAREDRWQLNGLDFSEELRVDLAVTAIGLSLGLSTLAGLVPSLSIKPLVEIARRVAPPPQSAPLAESLGLRTRPGDSDEPLALGSGGLPRRHLIGSGSELSQMLVFTVSTDDPPPASSEGYENPQPQRYYWRSLVYDIYTGQGWQSSPTTEIAHSPGALLIQQPETPGRYLVQKVDGAVDLNDLLYTAGMPVAADYPLGALWRDPPELGDWFAITIPSRRYQAISWLAAASEGDLRQAGDQYPEWLRQRYLQLPENLPERVRQLAGQLTEEHTAPYDQALAIERYLRRYPYTLDLPDPPRNRDLTDYFLFELQRGYCDYYATAMVVLARAAGLPARVVTGYASGAYDPLNARYRVVEADAHSWPEVFFPGYGWIEFEPTGGLSAIERPEQAVLNAPSSQPQALPDLAPVSPSIGWRLLRWVETAPGLAAGLIILIAAVIGLAVRYQHAHSSSRQQDIERMLVDLKRQASYLDIQTPLGQTAHELASALQDRLAAAAPGGLWGRILNPCRSELTRWTYAYTRCAYGPPPLPMAEVEQTISSWRKLRWRLWLARYWRNPHSGGSSPATD